MFEGEMHLELLPIDMEILRIALIGKNAIGELKNLVEDLRMVVPDFPIEKKKSKEIDVVETLLVGHDAFLDEQLVERLSDMTSTVRGGQDLHNQTIPIQGLKEIVVRFDLPDRGEDDITDMTDAQRRRIRVDLDDFTEQIDEVQYSTQLFAGIENMAGLFHRDLRR